MASVAVTWDTWDREVTIETVLSAEMTTHHGVLTDEHATSSYGVPVLVDDAGRVYGPADVPQGARLTVERSALIEVDGLLRYPPLAVAAARAGYAIRGCPA